MKIKSLFTIALAATTLFSCSKDGEDMKIPSGENFSVGLRIVQDNAVSRAEGTPVTNVTSVALSDGVLFFTDGTVITKVTTITSAPTDVTNGTNVNTTALGAGTAVNIANVPNSSSQIAIFCNMPADAATAAAIAALAAGSPVTQLEALEVKVEAMGDAAGAVVNVPLYGKGNITAPVAPSTTGSATVSLGAIAARIEISKLTAKAAGNVTDFELEGIFINNYYASQGVGGSLLTPSTLTNNGGTTSLYVGGSAAYPASMQPIYDWSLGIPQSASSVEPSTPGSVWAYNVFPAKNSVATDDNLPHIIVVFKNVEISGVPQTGYRYLTLDAYKPGGGGVSLDEFKRADVYTIANIEFDENDLDVTPETKPMDVDVTVTYIQWTPTAIEWDN